MFSSIRLQITHYGLIQNKIITELKHYKNPEGQLRHGLTINSNDSQIKLKSEEIIKEDIKSKFFCKNV